MYVLEEKQRRWRVPCLAVFACAVAACGGSSGGGGGTPVGPDAQTLVWGLGNWNEKSWAAAPTASPAPVLLDRREEQPVVSR